MANTRLIEEYIRDSGYKLQYIARAMQISTTALNQKLQGRTQFKLVSDMEKKWDQMHEIVKKYM